jgi:hypothetical protein
MEILTAQKLSEVLREPQVRLLRKVLTVLGPGRVAGLLAETLLTEQQGGMLTATGERRTVGGVFFQTVRQRATPTERRLLFHRGAQK